MKIEDIEKAKELRDDLEQISSELNKMETKPEEVKQLYVHRDFHGDMFKLVFDYRLELLRNQKAEIEKQIEAL